MSHLMVYAIGALAGFALAIYLFSHSLQTELSMQAGAVAYSLLVSFLLSSKCSYGCIIWHQHIYFTSRFSIRGCRCHSAFFFERWVIICGTSVVGSQRFFVLVWTCLHAPVLPRLHTTFWQATVAHFIPPNQRSTVWLLLWWSWRYLVFSYNLEWRAGSSGKGGK